MAMWRITVHVGEHLNHTSSILWRARGAGVRARLSDTYQSEGIRTRDRDQESSCAQKRIFHTNQFKSL